MVVQSHRTTFRLFFEMGIEADQSVFPRQCHDTPMRFSLYHTAFTDISWPSILVERSRTRQFVRVSTRTEISYWNYIQHTPCGVIRGSLILDA